ncbi:DsbA family protein [Cryobacterium sp. 1639]|nr:DsbA family protein [Cryobacterium sp. 1639]
MIERLLRAYFIEGRNLGDVETLADLANELQLDRKDTINALTTERHAAAIMSDQSDAATKNTTSVPFYVIDNRYSLSEPKNHPPSQMPSTWQKAHEHDSHKSGRSRRRCLRRRQLHHPLCPGVAGIAGRTINELVTPQLSGPARLAMDARARGLNITLFAHADPPAEQIQHAAGVKSMVVELHNNDYVFVLVPHNRLIDWMELRHVLHVNRLHLADAATALEATGIPRGAISPLGSTHSWPVLIDELLIGAETLRLGGGELGAGVLVDGPAFIHAFAARIAELTRRL